MTKLTTRGKKLARQAAATKLASVVNLRKRLKEQSKRITALEHEVQEQRRLSRRLAELADLVEELLIPAVNRDEDKLRALLEQDRERARSDG